MYVCVCVRGKQTKRETEREGKKKSIGWEGVREREREKVRERDGE